MMNTLTTILEKDNPNRGVSPRTSSFDEMRGLTPLANLVTSALTNQYSYDGLGNRTLRTVNGIQHRDVLDRSAALHNVLMTTDAAGNPLRYYIWGRGLVAQIETNGTVYYYHPDTRGSTLAMTDASGSTVAEYAYSPYGQIMNHTGVDTHYNWIGTYGVWHEGADLFHMKARYYNAAQRRFVTPDPIGINGGFNLYVYCGNNPLFYVDPLGLWGFTIDIGASFGHLIGFAGGVEFVYISGHGWNTYTAAGGGVMTPASGEVHVYAGPIFNIDHPDEYTKHFLTLAANSLPAGPYPGAGGGIFGWWKGPWGFKLEPVYGTPGASLVYEYYKRWTEYEKEY